MKHMDKKFPKGNELLREHTESTLEKNQKKRQMKKNPPELEVNSPEDIINKRINERLKRKQMLADAMNKIHDPDIA